MGEFPPDGWVTQERLMLNNFEHLPKTLRERVIAGYKWQQKKNSLGLLQDSLKKDVMEVMFPNLMKSH
ncbi:hypothetical protein IRJ41_010464 [Triplophysa rosa]|uniref:Uncharacterized protein n=1 Tax=Triplophysa rosa TaxID=992332 RepID=A0A9W7TS55_TRIRA|nr:hypothetical protein IRJ41_010464 [Triplophysa rosa]